MVSTPTAEQQNVSTELTDLIDFEMLRATEPRNNTVRHQVPATFSTVQKIQSR